MLSLLLALEKQEKTQQKSLQEETGEVKIIKTMKIPEAKITTFMHSAVVQIDAQ